MAGVSSIRGMGMAIDALQPGGVGVGVGASRRLRLRRGRFDDWNGTVFQSTAQSSVFCRDGHRQTGSGVL